MTKQEYNKLTRRDLNLYPVKFRTLLPLVNRLAKIPAGSTGIIVDKYNGLTVHFDFCPCCGVQARMTRIPFSHIEILETTTWDAST